MRCVLEERCEHLGVAPDVRSRSGRVCRFPRANGIIGHADMLDAEVRELHERGFVVLHGAVPPGEMELVPRASDAAVAPAAPGDVRVGSTTTRVDDFVNRGADFDDIYIFPPLLEACERVIGGPF